MNPYGQPGYEGADDYVLPPDSSAPEFVEYERLKVRSSSFYRVAQGSLAAIPLLFFFGFFLIIQDYADYVDAPELWSGAAFRGCILLSFFGTLGVLWTYRRALPAEFGSRSPWLAVLPFFVPGLNLYWYYAEFVRGFRDGMRALEELEGNRLNARSGAVFGCLALSCFSGALIVGVWSFLVTFVTRADEAALDFLIGRENFWGSNWGVAWACVATYGLFFGGLSFHLAALRRMTELTRRILELRQSVEPLATEAERIAARARLDEVLYAPPSR